MKPNIVQKIVVGVEPVTDSICYKFYLQFRNSHCKIEPSRADCEGIQRLYRADYNCIQGLYRWDCNRIPYLSKSETFEKMPAR